MEDLFPKYYEQELTFIREMADIFAKENPKAAAQGGDETAFMKKNGRKYGR